MTAPKGASVALVRGDRFVWTPSAKHRPRDLLFLEVRRVAKDGTWADIAVCTWAVMWTKRQQLPLPEGTSRYDWSTADLAAQEADHVSSLAGVL
jgi:hypothetical protein